LEDNFKVEELGSDDTAEALVVTDEGELIVNKEQGEGEEN
jgi:hypothetical protein